MPLTEKTHMINLDTRYHEHDNSSVFAIYCVYVSSTLPTRLHARSAIIPATLQVSHMVQYCQCQSIFIYMLKFSRSLFVNAAQKEFLHPPWVQKFILKTIKGS